MINNLKSYKEASSQLSLKEKIAQSFMPAVYINDSEESIQQMEELIGSLGIGGICFFHSRASAATNFEGPKEVIYNEDSLTVLKELIRRYQAASKFPLLIAIDAEWGLAMRIEKTAQYPYAITLGAMQNRENLIFKVGKHIGIACRKAGIHWNFAPVADINNNPDNPVIGYRSFGEDPYWVGRYAMAMCKGLQEAGVLTSAKHFPGHGDTATDSHLGLPVINKSRSELYENELQPFIKLMNHGVDSVMIGHLAVPVLSDGKIEPSTISHAVINRFLREEMGFDRVVVSDALNMHAVTKRFPKKGLVECMAYQAGTDVLCYAQHVEQGIDMILKNTSEEEIEKHFRRVWDLKQRIHDRLSGPAEDKKESYRDLMKQVAQESLSLVKGSPDAIAKFLDSHFAGVAVTGSGESRFLARVKKRTDMDYKCYDPNGKISLSDFTADQDHILLALYPPSAKPAGNFGLGDDHLNFINRLTENKRVLLYLFGNPYVLNLLKIEQFEGICVAYQDFAVFEENAAQHFLGISKARGKLPVTIKNIP